MARLVAFNNVSVDGCFADSAGDMSWAHQGSADPEFAEFTASNAKGDRRLLFGRVTWQMMASYWPTPMAAQQNPVVAGRMNALTKFVASRTLTGTTWQNTTLLTGDLVKAVRRLKDDGGTDIAILGSGTLVSQLAQAGLIDEFQLVVNPIVVGQGRSMFAGVLAKIPLHLEGSRAFRNGKVVLRYSPAR